MKSRVARLTLLILFIVSLGATAYLFWNGEALAASQFAAVRSFDDQARTTTRALLDMRAAQRAYVAPGQAAERWPEKVAGGINAVRTGLSALRASALSPQAQTELDVALETLDDFTQLDRRAREYTRTGQNLLASDLVFGDCQKMTGAIDARLQEAREAEITAGDAAVATYRSRQAFALTAGAAASALVVLLLLPGAEPTRYEPAFTKITDKDLSLADALSPWMAEEVEGPGAAGGARAAAGGDRRRAAAAGRTAEPAHRPVQVVEAAGEGSERREVDGLRLRVDQSEIGPEVEGWSAPSRVAATDPLMETSETVASAPAPREVQAEPATDYRGLASLCTDLARVIDTQQLPSLLDRASTVLDARGIILWIADPDGRELNPIVAHGYPAQLVNRLGTIDRNAENATAAAFRTSLLQTVNADSESNGAIVAPLVTPAGCVGVMAAEVRHGGQREESRLAAAAIVAAQLATLVGPPARSQNRVEAAGA
jgi:GAF domain